MKNFWSFIGITFIAVVLCCVILKYANAFEPADLVDWELIGKQELPEGNYLIVLHNPNPENPRNIVFLVNPYVKQIFCFAYFDGIDLEISEDVPSNVRKALYVTLIKYGGRPT